MPRSEPDAIAVSRYSTADVPSAHRFLSWSKRDFPSVAALFDVRPIGTFWTEADRVDLDGITVQFSRGSAREFTRTAEHARADGIDLLALHLASTGGAAVTTGDRRAALEPGNLILLDLAQPSAFWMPEGQSIQVAVPRKVAAAAFGPVHRLHGRAVAPDAARLFANFIETLRGCIGAVDARQAPLLARSLLDLLSVTLGVRQAADERDGGDRARALIAGDLAAADMGVPRLLRELGSSRSRLFRLFAADGGVERYIRNARLDAVRAALLDPREMRTLTALAEANGFSDGAHLSRAFRDRFGMTPGEMRRTPSI